MDRTERAGGRPKRRARERSYDPGDAGLDAAPGQRPHVDFAHDAITPYGDGRRQSGDPILPEHPATSVERGVDSDSNRAQVAADDVRIFAQVDGDQLQPCAALVARDVV